MTPLFKKIVLLWIVLFSSFLFADEAITNVTISNASANEASGKMSFTVTIDQLPLSILSPVRIDYTTINGTATAGDDYTAKTSNLLTAVWFTSLSSSTSKTIDIDLLDDFNYEGDEYFYTKITTSTNGYTITSDGTATGVIGDNDTQPLSISISGQSVTETDTNSSILFKVQVNQPTPTGGLHINYNTATSTSTSNDKATAGEDYTAISNTLTIPEGSDVGYISIPIIGDLTPENTEEFLVQLTSTDQGTISSTESEAIGKIYDDDEIQVMITSSNILEGNIGETNQMEFQISLKKSYTLNNDFIITYTTEDGSTPTATNSIDYKTLTSSLTFSKNNPSEIKTVLVDIIGDDKIEEDEYLRIVIRDNSNNILTSSQSLILNDDGSFPSLSFEQDLLSIMEGNSSNILNINLILDNPALEGSSFHYETWNDSSSDSNAEDDDDDDQYDNDDNDYVYTDGDVNLTAGVQSYSIQISINGDTKIEDDEKFYIKFTNMTNLKWGTYNEIEITILNDDGSYPSLSSSQNIYEVIEGNNSTKTINFQFALNKPALANSSFNYYTTDGTATIGNNDYISVNSPYIFKGGETNITLPITINGDEVLENDELFYLKIVNENNLTLIGLDSLTGKILNDDEQEFPFSCTEKSFISFNRDSLPTGGDSLFDTISLAEGTLLSSDIVTSVNGVNSIGYNIKDNFVWGYNLNLNKVVRIDSQKKAKIYDIAGLPSRFYVAADVDKNGILYLFSRGDSTEQKTLIAVDLNTLTLLPPITLTQIINTADMAFNPLDGHLYFIQTGTSNLYKIILSSDGTQGTVVLVGDTQIGQIDPIINFFDKDGNFYFNKDLVSMYKINVGSSAQATWFSSLDSQLKNGDGARCAQAPVTVPIADNVPFTCDGSMYISSSIKRGTGETGKMWLHKIDTQENPFAFTVIEDNGDSRLYNALAYSEAGDANSTNFIFGLYNDELLKIGLNGKAISLGKITALSSFLSNRQLFAGAIYNGYYYISGPGVDYDKIFKVNLTDKSVTEINLDKAISIFDFSFTPDGAYLHAIIEGGQLVKIDVTSGVVTFIGLAHTGYQFDSTFSDDTGRFFANDSQGNGFFEFDLLTGNKNFISNSQPATYNDGANCLTASLIFNDYSDAPLSYGSPKHNIANGVFMGTEVDHDIHAYTNENADGDDTNGMNDDDGVTLLDGSDLNNSYFPLNQTHELKIKVSKDGFLNMWIDFNADGTFDSGDKIITAGALTAGEHTLSFTVPSSANTVDKSYMRFRFSSTANLNPTENATDGEVEDYMVHFGSAFIPLKGVFNIERTNSELISKINSSERDAWYTQLSGRDFNYAVLFYEENLSDIQIAEKVTFKVELINNENHTNVTQMAPYYGYFSSILPNHKVIISASNDLDKLPALKDVSFKISYAVNPDNSLVQADCTSGDYKTCYETLSSTFTIKEKLANDNFAIRPSHFYMKIEDRNITLQENIASTLTPINLATGYEYNLTINALHEDGTTIENTYTNADVNMTLLFKDDTINCFNQQDYSYSKTLNNGQLITTFTNPEVGQYLLHLEDKKWTKVDWENNKTDCNISRSDISSSGDIPSGCTIASNLDINLSFYPYQFDLNSIGFNVLPVDEFDTIYMSEVNETFNNVAIQLSGDVIAQNMQGVQTENFTSQCAAEDISVWLDATITSDTGVNTTIQTTADKNGNRGNVFFNRLRSINNFPFAIDRDIPDITSPIIIGRADFLDTNRTRAGMVNIDFRYNLDKNITQPINPISVNFQAIHVNSVNSTSNTAEVNNFVPDGNESLIALRYLYFTRVKPHSYTYPRVIYSGHNVSLDTPLSVEIFCDFSNNYCANMQIFNNTTLYASPNRQKGWYIASNHNQNLDGNITQLNSLSTGLTVAPNNNQAFTGGQNPTIRSTVINNSHTLNKVQVIVPPQLKFDPKPTQDGNPLYAIPQANTPPSEWTGIGNTGYIIGTEPNTDDAKKASW